MADEEKFDKALRATRVFDIIEINGSLIHPTLPNCFLEVDNIAQRGKSIFVFEGKAQKEDAAITQLLERYESLKDNKKDYIEEGSLNDYNLIRLFFYSFQRNLLVEFDSKGKSTSRFKFYDFKELVEILRNL